VAIAGPARGQEDAPPPPPHHHQPPPEAFAACEGKSASDTCSVTLRERTVEGTCAAFADSGQLVCRPPHREHRLPSQAFEACSGKAEAEACSVTLPDRTLEGTCAASHEGTLFCKPARPPPAS
jgi:hypothetical protein